MRMFRNVTIATVLAIAPVFAQQSTPPQAAPKPEPKEAKEAPSPAGKWSMTISSDQGNRQATLDIKLEGKKVTGSLASEMGEAPVLGEFAEGKLLFSITMQTGNGDFQIGFAGALKEDGTLAGTLDYGQGELYWTAARIKEK